MSRQAPVGEAIGTWPRLDGAPTPVQPESKSYDRCRRKMAHFVGMDFLFTQREYFQSVQTTDQGRKVLVNSDKHGNLLTVKEVPPRFETKPWFTGKFRFPREYLGITRIDERVGKLSFLVHLLTRYGFPTRAIAKSVYRLSLTWMNSRFEDMRKHVASIARKLLVRTEKTRSPWRPINGYSQYPCRHGEKIHANGIIVPLWDRSPTVKEG